jgi:integrase/recombinase XerC
MLCAVMREEGASTSLTTGFCEITVRVAWEDAPSKQSSYPPEHTCKPTPGAEVDDSRPGVRMETPMLGKQAKIISPQTLRQMLAYARRTRQPERDTVIVWLSVKAGLRACEMARLEWSMVLTDKGKIGDAIDIRNAIAKRGSGRRIPMHPSLRKALADLWRVRTSDIHIVASNRGGPMRPNSIVNWFVAMFDALNLEGCSSHSGRRTFITAAAKNVHRAGGSLRDVQLLAGHQSIETTQRYIDGDTQSQRRLVSLI